MADLDKMFAAMADVSAEDSTCDYIIDEDLRVIAIPERGVVLGVEGDKDVTRVRFRMGKMWRGNDMSQFDLRINYENANGDKNYYTVVNKYLDGDTVVFDWIVAADAAAYRGDVFFIVVGLITTGGVVNCAFHTTLGKAKCLEGLVVDTSVDIPEIRDFMATLKAEVEAYGQTFVDASRQNAEAAKASADASAASAAAAKTSEEHAAANERNAKTSETNANASAEKAAASETNASASAASAKADAEKAEAAKTAAEEARDNAAESETNAAASANAAKTSETNAAASETAAKESEQNAKASETHASTSEANAKGSENKSAEYLQATKEYFDQVRTITLGGQGWYETPDALKAAVPVGENGWWAVIGTTDSIWVWDSDTSTWRDTMITVDLSDYYTRKQVEEKLAEKAGKASAEDLISMLNALSTDDATPEDADYYVSQYAGGGEETTTYHRRPMSALWAYIKAKAATVFAALNHTHTKADVGLGNVDNTADSEKSVAYGSTAGVAAQVGNGGNTQDPMTFHYAGQSGQPPWVWGGPTDYAGDNYVYNPLNFKVNTAAYLGRGGDVNVPMVFHWAGQGGQPTWMWGGSDGTNMYVYNPSNFNVNYANSAGSVPWSGVSGAPSIPASAISASGANYVRFSDGTQICWTTGLSNYSTWTFPVPFANTNYLGIVAGYWPSNYDTDMCFSKKTTTQGSGGQVREMLAIGRWY